MRLIDAEYAKYLVKHFGSMLTWSKEDIISEIIRHIDKDAIDAEPVTRCKHCTIKKAVQHKDGIVWRCPHRTGDVKMEGYCESGVRADGC